MSDPDTQLAPRAMGIDLAALSNKALELGDGGVDALERVLALAERERDRMARLAYDDAMLEVQREMPRILKRGENTQTQSRYPKLEDVDRHLRPLYTGHGFRISFDTEPCDMVTRTVDQRSKTETVLPWVTHVATVTHTGGHVERHHLSLPVDSHGPKGGPVKTPMHGAGSALSYAQRRLTIQAFGAVATGEDDDAQAASAPEPPEPVTQEQADTLRQHVDELFASPHPFLVHMRAERFEDVPSARYGEAMAKLDARRTLIAESPAMAEKLAAQKAAKLAEEAGE